MREIVKSTITVGNINTRYSSINKKVDRKSVRPVKHYQQTITDIYRTLHPTIAEDTFFSVNMEHPD